ncbi:MAG: hypothetical protein WD872_07265 [Pirellulaceae bacterium]
MSQLGVPLVDFWQASNLELIGFPIEPERALEQSWWESLAGADYESTRKRHERVDVGAFDEKSLFLTIDALRVKWTLGPLVKISAADGVGAVPFAGPFPETCGRFSSLMARWLNDSCPPIRRLAFGAKLLIPTEGREPSYELLDRWLSAVKVDQSSTDFQYRINRKRSSASGLSGLEINRLSTWSAVKMEVGMQVMASGAARAISRETYGCMLQIDINTHAERKEELPRDRLLPLWEELVRFGSEIAALGDVP